MVNPRTKARIYEMVNREANQKHLYDRDQYEFTQKHLWIPKFKKWGKAPMHAFMKGLMH